MNTIEERVMGNVAAIFIGRSLVSQPALKLYALALSLFAIGKLVWVSKVFENFFALENPGLESFSHFLFSAFGHTHLLVQMTLLVAIFALLSLLVDIARASTTRRFAL